MKCPSLEDTSSVAWFDLVCSIHIEPEKIESGENSTKYSKYKISYLSRICLIIRNPTQMRPHKYVPPHPYESINLKYGIEICVSCENTGMNF